MTEPIRADALDADRNLLFGVLALQADAITRSQFIEGCSAWATQKTVPLPDLLVQRGWLSPTDRADVERLLARKLKKHQGNIRSGLAEAANDDVRQSLAEVPVAAVQKTVAGMHLTEGMAKLATVSFESENRDRYRLSRLHSKGGIGQVWLAHDKDLGRDVALKELRPENLKNEMAVARFLEEARITGQLEHPGIVPVYELARRKGEEQAYYTMRFIRGRTLSEAIRDYHHKRRMGKAGSLDQRALLGAFIGVCNTVAYAHSRGVVHRDLKGSNIVLGDFGEVIVLDWGLAKIIGDRASSQSTPSTEQPSHKTPVGKSKPDAAGAKADFLSEIRLQPLSIERASAIDLTVQGQIMGTPAYMAPEQAEGRLDAIDARTDVYGLGAILYEILTGDPPFVDEESLTVLRRVLHEEPASPRERVPETPPALCAVCLKALAKRREDRYPGAGELALDLQHYLADDPVSAYQEPWTVRAGRWGRRHRTFVSSAAALLVSAVAALSVGMVLLQQANARTEEQRDLAEQNLTEAQHQRSVATASLKQARDAEQRANKSASIAQAINSFLVNDLLAQAAPELNARSKKITVEEVVNRAADKISFPDLPETEAAVRAMVGDTYMMLGLYAPGEAQLRKAVEIRRRVLGPHHRDTIEAMLQLGEILGRGAKVPEAVAQARQTLEICRRILGSSDKFTMRATNGLATFLQEQGNFTEAEPLVREALETRARVLGPNDGFTIAAMNNLARLLQDRGRLAEAEPLFRQALETARRVHGPEHPKTIPIIGNLGAFLLDKGELDEAEKLLQQAVDLARRIQGPEHAFTLIGVNHWCRLLERQGKLSLGESMGRQNLETCRRTLGNEHRFTATAMEILATVLRDQGKPAQAEPLIREAFTVRRKASPLYTAGAADILGAVLIDTSRPAEAEPLLREGLRIRMDIMGRGPWQTANTESVLGASLAAQKRFDEAEPILESGFQALKSATGAPPRLVREAADRLVQLYTAWGKADKAASWKTIRDHIQVPGGK